MLEVILFVAAGLFILALGLGYALAIENQRLLRAEIRKEKRKRDEKAIKQKMERAKETHGSSVGRTKTRRDDTAPFSNPIIYPVGPTECSSSSSSSGSSDSGSSSSSGGC